MSIVLGEATNAHQTMQRTGWLVAMNRTKFSEPQRQIAIGLQAVFEDLHMARAVHRLNRKHAMFSLFVFRMHEGVSGFNREHVFLIPAPVTGCLPE